MIQTEGNCLSVRNSRRAKSGSVAKFQFNNYYRLFSQTEGIVDVRWPPFPQRYYFTLCPLVSGLLSYRNIEEMMLERSIRVDHATINRWVLHYSPKLESMYRQKKLATGTSIRMDETYIKVKGARHSLHRAVDKEGKTVDFLYRKNRDKVAARAFFDKAFGLSGQPEKVTIDKSGSNFAALTDINKQLENPIEIRQVKYMNNVVE